jgi:hypothetical protein
MLLIDLTSFGFELAAVLAKVTSYVPTTYAALLARDAYMQVVHIVDEMMVQLNHGSGETDLFGNSVDPLSPPKRPRGRPRKTTTKGTDM